jgi:hypothetical protein
LRLRLIDGQSVQSGDLMLLIDRARDDITGEIRQTKARLQRAEPPRDTAPRQRRSSQIVAWLILARCARLGTLMSRMRVAEPGAKNVEACWLWKWTGGRGETVRKLKTQEKSRLALDYGVVFCVVVVVVVVDPAAVGAEVVCSVVVLVWPPKYPP